MVYIPTKLRIPDMRVEYPLPVERKLIIRKFIMEITYFLMLLISAVVLAFASCGEELYAFNEILSKRVLDLDRETEFLRTEIDFNSIVTFDEWWKFVDEIFLKCLHEDVTEPTRYIMGENLLLGPPRFRQQRVRPNTCRIPDYFEGVFDSCYGKFSSNNAEIEEEYKGTKYIKPSTFNNFIKDQRKGLSDGGYVKELTFELQKNKAIIEELVKSDWLDRASRVIVLEFGLFNNNLKLLQNFKLAIEMPSVGGVLPKFEMNVIPIYSYWTTPKDYGTWIFCGLFYAGIAFGVVLEVHEIRHMRWQYFCTVWNYFDVTIIIMSCLCCAYQIWHGWYVEILLERFHENPNSYLNIDALAYAHSLSRNLFAFGILLQFLRIFKYCNFSYTMVQFTLTINRCFEDICGFFLMFFVIFLAYALVGTILFASTSYEFNNLSTSMITVMKMLVGQCDYAYLESANQFFGPLYFVSYILTVFFVMFNLFLAILTDTYMKVKMDVHDGQLKIDSFMGKTVRGWLDKFIRCIKRLTSKRNRMENEDAHFDEHDRAILRSYFEELHPSSAAIRRPEHFELASKIKSLEERLIARVIDLEELILKLDIIVDSAYKAQMKKYKEKLKETKKKA